MTGLFYAFHNTRTSRIGLGLHGTRFWAMGVVVVSGGMGVVYEIFDRIFRSDIILHGCSISDCRESRDTGSLQSAGQCCVLGTNAPFAMVAKPG